MAKQQPAGQDRRSTSKSGDSTNAAGASKKAMAVYAPYSYEHGENKEKRSGFTFVGVAFPPKEGKEGFNVEIRPGLSISGRLIVRPFKDDAEAAAATSGGGRFHYDPTDNTPLI